MEEFLVSDLDRNDTTMNLRRVVLLVCIAATVAANAFTFEIDPNSKVCFTEEIPSKSDFYVAYSASDAYAKFIDVKLFSPSLETIYSNNGKQKGQYKSQSTYGGDYKLCFYSRQASGLIRSSSVLNAHLVTVKFEYGARSSDYRDLAVQEKLKPIETQMRALEDVVRSIHTEYIYLKDKEAEMRSTNESMSRRMVWISITIMIFFGLFWVLQLRHLKQYFRKKRMID